MEQPENRQPDGEVGETEAEPQAMEGSSRSVREIQGATHSVGKNDSRRIKEIMARGTSRSILKDLGGFLPVV